MSLAEPMECRESDRCDAVPRGLPTARWIDWIEAHVPREAVHSSTRRKAQYSALPNTAEPNSAAHSYCADRSVVFLRIPRGIGTGNRISARVRANHLSCRHRRSRASPRARSRQGVIDHRALRWILACRNFRRPRRRIIPRETHAHRCRRLHQICRRSPTARRRHRPQRRHVVENPESAAMSCSDEIGAHAVRRPSAEIAHRDRRHVDAERLPVIAIIERNPYLSVGTTI